MTTLKKMQRINWSEQNLWFKVRFWFTYVLNRYLRLLPMVLVAAWFSWMIWPVLYRGPNRKNLNMKKIEFVIMF